MFSFYMVNVDVPTPPLLLHFLSDFYTKAQEVRDKAMVTSTFEDDSNDEANLKIKKRKAGPPPRYQDANEAEADGK